MFVRRWTGDDLRRPGDRRAAATRARATSRSIPAAGFTRCGRGWTRDGLAPPARGLRRRRRVAVRERALQTEDQVGAPRVAAAADHVGVAVCASRSGGVSQINAVAIGPDAPVDGRRSRRPSSRRRRPTRRRSSTRRSWCGRCVASCAFGCGGSNRFVNLTSIDDIPFGATIDTKRGEVELRSRGIAHGRRPVRAAVRRLVPRVVRAAGSRTSRSTSRWPAARGAGRRRSASRSRASCGATGPGGSGPPATTRRRPCAAPAGSCRTRCAGTRTRVRQGSVSVRDRIRKRTVDHPRAARELPGAAAALNSGVGRGKPLGRTAEGVASSQT